MSRAIEFCSGVFAVPSLTYVPRSAAVAAPLAHDQHQTLAGRGAEHRPAERQTR